MWVSWGVIDRAEGTPEAGTATESKVGIVQGHHNSRWIQPCQGPMLRAFPREGTLSQTPYHRRAGGLGLVLAGLSIASCIHVPASQEPESQPQLSLVDITAPVRGSGEPELSRLGTSSAALLRKAWILDQTARSRKATQVLNSILYARPGPAPTVEALAYYIRSGTFARQGDPERALEDATLARQLAVSPELQRLLDERLGSINPSRRVVAKPAGPAPTALTMPRQSWNAGRPNPRKLDPMVQVDRLTIHHSATVSRSTNQTAVATQIRGFQQFHMGDRGWGDIGYHYLIDPAGRIWEGRDMKYQGAHAGGDNNVHNVGICLLGKFTADGQRPSGQQIQAMEQLVAALVGRYSIPLSDVKTHKEFIPQTVCPGPLLQPYVTQMRRNLATLAASQNPTAAAIGK